MDYVQKIELRPAEDRLIVLEGVHCTVYTPFCTVSVVHCTLVTLYTVYKKYIPLRPDNLTWYTTKPCVNNISPPVHIRR